MTVIEVQKLHPEAKLPTRGSEQAAGYDLYALLDGDGCVHVPPHATVMIPTGLKLAVPIGYFGGIFARSGLAAREGLRPANCVGVIDSDYRGECMVAVHNDSEGERVVRSGDRVAQLVIMPFLQADFRSVEELSQTQRGEGGFGSTGQ